MILTILYGVFLLMESSRANENYPSGLIHLYEASHPPEAIQAVEEKISESASIERFLKSNFSKKFAPPFSWQLEKRWVDATHAHSEYQLYYEGIAVLDYFVKFHYHLDGFLEYVSSLLETDFKAEGFPQDRDIAQKVKKRVEQLIHRKSKGPASVKKIYYVLLNRKKAVSAYEVTYSSGEENIYKHWILKADDLSVIEDRRTMRFLTSANQKVYKTSPLGMGSTFDVADIVDLSSLTNLSNSYIRVRREENTTTPVLRDVDPTVDYSATGTPVFSTDPASYAATTCVAPQICPNQSFDAVNVYYHINDFRTNLNSYFSTLGATATVSSLLSDPLQVIVNSLTINSTNNAAFVSSTCQSGIDRCLVFFRPAALVTSSCTGSSASIVFYDLAREALVLIHEYQHYVTDRITNMIAGSFSYNAGDALHEGYSDYFGASQVSGLSGATVTKVGEYAFQNCTTLIRDVSSLRVFQDASSDADPHLSGLSWASGLWYLRTQFGRTAADLLALKSLFFLSRKPSFYEATEALVKADKAINAGVNVATIRSVFYTQLKLLGGKTGVFSDSNRGIVQLGFKGCANVFITPLRWAAGLSLLYFGVLLLLGRLWRRK